MTDIHHGHGTGTTVIEDRGGPATVLGVLAVAALIGFLVWLFAFSGVVFDRNSGGGGTNVNIEQREEAPPQQPVEQPT